MIYLMHVALSTSMFTPTMAIISFKLPTLTRTETSNTLGFVLLLIIRCVSFIYEIICCR